MMSLDQSRWSALGRFGPFFVVDSAPQLTAGWAPVTDLADPVVLDHRVTAVAAALGAGAGAGGRVAVPVRVAASIAQLGLSARLSAVALAAGVDGLVGPTADQLLYLDRLGGPFPVGLRTTRVRPGAAEWPDSVLALVGPIAETTIATYRLSPRVVWGNVGSGLTGAARMITSGPTSTAATGLAAEELLATALHHVRLRGTMTEPGPAGRQRNSCCLIYRLAGTRAAVCGDCVLAAG